MQLSAVSSGVADARKVMDRAKGEHDPASSCSWTRSTGGARRSRTSCSRRRGRNGDVHRRDDGEPLLLADHAAAVAVPAAPARAALARGPPRADGSGARRSHAGSASRTSRGPRRRLTTWPSIAGRRRADRAHRSGGRRARRARARRAMDSRWPSWRRPCRRRRSCTTARATPTTTSSRAFIKSIRGSDPDATLFWLARMLEAGEDARYIARRMVVHAQRGHRTGRPAGAAGGDGGGPGGRVRRPARGAAEPGRGRHLPGPRAQVEQRDRGARPGHGGRGLRRTRARCTCGMLVYPGAARLGHGKGYKYPHDYPGHSVEQEYRPARFQGNRVLRAVGRGRGDRRRGMRGSIRRPRV